MKHKLITNLKKKVLLVDGLPEYASRFKVYNDRDKPYLSYNVGVETFWEYVLPEGNWSFISKLKDLKDNDVKDIVESSNYSYKNYLHNNKPNGQITGIVRPYYRNAIDSFFSALEAERVWFENPYGTYDQALKYFDTNNWQEAEKNVFSQNTLIFIEQ